MIVYRWVCRNCNKPKYEVVRPTNCSCNSTASADFRKSYSVVWSRERNNWMQGPNAISDEIEK